MTVVINGTTGITDVDGSAAAPALTGSSTNTGTFFPAANTVGFATNGTEAMRIDSSQNVGIGTSSPAAKLDVASEIRVTSGANIGRLLTDGSDFYVGTRVNIPMRFETNSTTQAIIGTSGNFQFNSGYGSVATAYGCRAWVNFNGTTASPSTIRGSGNVTSVTKNGTGDYTVNFTNALPDANYCVNAVGGLKAETFGLILQSNAAGARAAGSFRFLTESTADATQDATWVNVAIFR